MNKQLYNQMKLNQLCMETISKLANALTLAGRQDQVNDILKSHQEQMNILSATTQREMVNIIK